MENLNQCIASYNEIIQTINDDVEANVRVSESSNVPADEAASAMALTLSLLAVAGIAFKKVASVF